MTEFDPTYNRADTATLRQPVESERVLLGRGESVVFSPELPIGIDAETYASIVGRIGLPNIVGGHFHESDPDRDLRVVYRPDVGFMICPPGAKILNGLPESSGWAKDPKEMPLPLGSSSGIKVVIGRKNIEYSVESNDDKKASWDYDAVLGQSFKPLINPTVSRRQVEFLIKPGRVMQVTDLSTNGTLVQKAK